MGKKKKQAKRQRKVAEKVAVWLDDTDLTERELILAGIGVMAEAVDRKKKKTFKRAVKAGRRIAELGGIDIAADAPATDDAEISYRSKGGGWYDVAVDGVTVDSVKGEEEAAARAADLFSKYAALDPEDQADKATELRHSGGGWYDIVVRGVPVDRVRGRESAEERFAAINA